MQSFVPQASSVPSFWRGGGVYRSRSACTTARSASTLGQKQSRFLSSPRKRTRAPHAPAASIRMMSDKKSADEKSLRVAVLVSGGGRSLENLSDYIDSGSLTRCKVEVVVASKKTAGAIARAEKRNIPTRVLRLKDFESDVERFSDAISDVLDDFQVDLVIMAGWMHFYRIPLRYDGKVINIHPSLIPAFCGKGYYGNRVHEAVLKFGAKITGCTVHLADNKYDHGPIIVQKPVPVLDTDTADDLAARVFESEKKALPEAIQLFVDGRLRIEGGVVKVTPVPESSRV